MLDCYYVNSAGAAFYFNIENNRLNKSDIRDYAWEYVEQYNKIKQFYKNLTQKSLIVNFFTVDEKKMLKSAEELYAICDYDVRMLTPGRLFIGDYYVDAYIVASTKPIYDNGILTQINLSVMSDFRWRKDVYKIFGLDSSSDTADYERDYLFDYTTADIGRMQVESIAPFDFEIVFQGQWENPQIVVGRHLYQVYTSLEVGDYLKINSVTKTIKKVLSNGMELNEFDSRNRDSYIFEKMGVENGVARVDYTVGHIASITAFVERSEPKWI